MNNNLYDQARQKAFRAMQPQQQQTAVCEDDGYQRLVAAINEVLENLGLPTIGNDDDPEMVFRQQLGVRLATGQAGGAKGFVLPDYDVPEGAVLVPCAQPTPDGRGWVMSWGVEFTHERVIYRAPIYDSIPVWRGDRDPTSLQEAGFRIVERFADDDVDDDDEEQLE